MGSQRVRHNRGTFTSSRKRLVIRASGWRESQKQRTKTIRGRPPETPRTDWKYRNTGYEIGVSGQGQVREALICLKGPQRLCCSYRESLKGLKQKRSDQISGNYSGSGESRWMNNR